MTLTVTPLPQITKDTNPWEYLDALYTETYGPDTDGLPADPIVTRGCMANLWNAGFKGLFSLWIIRMGAGTRTLAEFPCLSFEGLEHLLDNPCIDSCNQSEYPRVRVAAKEGEIHHLLTLSCHATRLPQPMQCLQLTPYGESIILSGTPTAWICLLSSLAKAGETELADRLRAAAFTQPKEGE